MNNKRICSLKFPLITHALVLFLVISVPVHPQEEDTERGTWEIRWDLDAEGQKNTNIFRLSPSQKNRLALNDSDDVVSGRFNDMHDDMDYILLLAPGFEIRTKSGLFDRSLSLSLRAEYEYYFYNPRRGNISLEAALQQKITKKGKVKLLGSFLPEYFSKNFLADASDMTGYVSDRERIYKPGVYSEWNAGLIWEQKFRFINSDIESDVGTGYRTRHFETPFGGRDQYASLGLLDIKIFPLKRMSINLNYEFEWTHTPVSEEVLILDEPDYIIDFNNDMDFADENRRTVQTVNRSYVSNLIGAGAAFKITSRWDVYLEAEYLMKDFKSKEKIDPHYKGRFDHRTSIRLGLDYELMNPLLLFVEYRNVLQRTNRPEDPDMEDEITDYTINIITTGVKWHIY